MATKIKLMRLGKTRQPYYRIVVADSRNKRDGRSIEEIGKYHPKQDPSYIEVDPERAAYWLGVGAEPTEAVRAILRVSGDWQKFKGEPAPEPMKVKAPKPDRRAAFEAATQHTAGEPTAEATTPKKKAEPTAEATTPKKRAESKAEKAESKAEKSDAKAEKSDTNAETKAEAKTDDAGKPDPQAEDAAPAEASESS